MKIYFAGAIYGGRKDASVYAEIIGVLKEYGTVFTEHVGDATLGKDGEDLSAEAVYTRDLNWIKEADVFVAEVTNPSHGAGYEVALAEQAGKPILCLFRGDAQRGLSKMLFGNPSVTVREYNHIGEAKAYIDTFLNML